jgi:hypothetical protein
MCTPTKKATHAAPTVRALLAAAYPSLLRSRQQLRRPFLLAATSDAGHGSEQAGPHIPRRRVALPELSAPALRCVVTQRSAVLREKLLATPVLCFANPRFPTTILVV